MSCLAIRSAHAAPTDTATALGTASAVVVEPLTTRPLDDLDFGAVVVSQSAGGSVTVPPDTAAATYTGLAASACSASDCGAHPARFAVRGEPGRRYQVALPGEVYALGRSRASVSLLVTRLTMRTASFDAEGQTGLLDESGRDAFSVGGTLVVPASTPADRYEAKIEVIVTYS